MNGVSGHAAPTGAPGLPHRWVPALKQAIGTAFVPSGAASPVWFTVAEGALSEVFYPSVDRAQIAELEFAVTDGKRYFSSQKQGTTSSVRYLNEGMTVEISGRDKEGRYSFIQEIVTDPTSPVVRIQTRFRWNQSGLRLFFLIKPAINNTGADTTGETSAQGLFATKPSLPYRESVHLALVPAQAQSVGFRVTSGGYSGFSDGWQDLARHFHLTSSLRQIGPGNIGLTGEVAVPPGTEFVSELALSFGKTRLEAQAIAQASLAIPFSQVRSAYERGWQGYLLDLQRSPLGNGKRFITESLFARRSAQIIKMHEDKRRRGAIVASLSKPAIPDRDRAFDGSPGYHVIWPRDLYYASLALLAAGDVRTPLDALGYLVSTQRADGSWPQNFWVDGTPYWKGIQLDGIAFPILLAGQIQRRGARTLRSDELEMVRKAAAFLIAHGPATQLDRWEEVSGHSPATLAVVIAALRTTAHLTGETSALAVANQWQSQLERWTLALDGPYGRNYYIRIGRVGSKHGEPGAGILDGGFMQLVRMGIREALDPRILTTLRLLENPKNGLAAPHPANPLAIHFRRYTNDKYGVSGTGGFWPLLAGERGHLAVSQGSMDQARAQLFILERSATEAGLIPEQIVTPPSDRVVVGWGVACPLVWAHAEDILLHRSIEEGTVFDAPRDTLTPGF